MGTGSALWCKGQEFAPKPEAKIAPLGFFPEERKISGDRLCYGLVLADKE